MRKILFAFCFLFSFASFAQGGPKVDVIKFRDQVTTTIRNTFNVPVGEIWIVWNETTGQFEYADENDVWAQLVAAVDQTANYTWSGTHTFSNDVSFLTADLLMGGTSNIVADDSFYMGTPQGTSGRRWQFFMNTGASNDLQLLYSTTDQTDYAAAGYSGVYYFPTNGVASDSQDVLNVGNVDTAPTISAGAFSGKLTSSDNTLQELANAVDALTFTGTEISLTDAGAYFGTDNAEAALQQLAGDVLEDNNIILPTSTVRYLDVPASSDFVFILGGLTEVLTIDGAGSVEFNNYAPTVPDLAYAASWNGSLATPTRNAVYDEMEKKINSDVTGEPTGSDAVSNIVSLTQAEYNAGTPVSGTAYIITDPKTTYEYVLPLGAVGTDLATGTFVNFVPVHQAITITGVSLHVNTAPTGSVATIDINEDGVTILSTKLTVDATENWSSTAAAAAVISDTAIDANSVISVDIDGVGSTTPGTDGTVTIYYTVD